MSEQSLTADEHRFIDDIASLLTPWGMPQVTARLYAYLLLSADAVTLDQMSEELGVSKSSASVAARLLERYFLARRFSERGSKRVFYEASEVYGGVLKEQSSLLGSLARLLRNRAPAVGSGVTRQRLEEAATFYRSIHEAMEEAIQHAVDASDKKP